MWETFLFLGRQESLGWPHAQLWICESLLSNLRKLLCSWEPPLPNPAALLPSVQILDINNGQCLCSHKLSQLRFGKKHPLEASLNTTPQTSEKPKQRAWPAGEQRILQPGQAAFHT